MKTLLWICELRFEHIRTIYVYVYTHTYEIYMQLLMSMYVYVLIMHVCMYENKITQTIIMTHDASPRVSAPSLRSTRAVCICMYI